jgi:hypothetical protein
MEQKLQTIENGQYKNINLKPKFNKVTKKKEGGLDIGNYVIAEKLFAEGKAFEKTWPGQAKPSTSYSCRAVIDGDEVSFWLNEREHKAYAPLGGVGDKVKITRVEDRVVVNPVNGAETPWPELKFEEVLA